mgnify:CR=1 FL=1
MLVIYERNMLERITGNAIVHGEKRGYFDEHIYAGLKTFIGGDTRLPEGKDREFSIPSFEAVVKEINSYALHQDVRVRIISETLNQILDEISVSKRYPSFLLSYLCRETLKHAVLRKFNKVIGGECVDLLGLSHKIGDNVAEANDVFLSLRICDPSVYTGDFLCIMLNEMIAVKSQLGILVDKSGNPLYQYKFVAGENGALSVFDKKVFKMIILDGATSESRYIQEALLEEKMNILRNCLFGVDADPVKVLACKLRIWLDVIVTLDGIKGAELPFVESNILCGDALISRFSLKDDLLVALKNINQTVADYQKLADNIKLTKEPDGRHYLKELM